MCSSDLQELNFALSRERRVLAVHLEETELTVGIELSLSNKQAILKHELAADVFAEKLIGAVRSLMPVIAPVDIGITAGESSVDEKSVAILPFVNRSSDEEIEYLCDGTAEELIIGLSKIESLKIASQLQSFAFKGGVQDTGAIGRKLKVATVLTGSVQKSVQRVRVNATLTETDSGKVLWAERYDGNMEDI